MVMAYYDDVEFLRYKEKARRERLRRAEADSPDRPRTVLFGWLAFGVPLTLWVLGSWWALAVVALLLLLGGTVSFKGGPKEPKTIWDDILVTARDVFETFMQLIGFIVVLGVIFGPAFLLQGCFAP